MSSIEIAQNSFPWEAVSTLVSGALAVVAAFFVGIKQTSILNQQTKISERQLRLAETTLREKLFDRRLEIYESINEYMSEAARTGAPPIISFPKFYDAIIKSKFLLSKALAKRLEELLEADRNWRLSGGRLKRSNLSDSERTTQETKEDAASDIIFTFSSQMREAFASDLDLSNI